MISIDPAMHIPSHFKEEDLTQILGFVRRYPFGILVSSFNGEQLATHVPFVTEQEGEQLVLYTHIAAENAQCRHLPGAEVLMIFSEPHAYISPSLYESTVNVPTWDYMAVHLYGRVELLSTEQGQSELMEKMIAAFEPGYADQYTNLPDAYRLGLLRGICGMKITVTKIQAIRKLSQNKKATERENISRHLMQSDEETAREIGRQMQDPPVE